MKRSITSIMFLAALLARAQEPNPTQQPRRAAPPPQATFQTGDSTPIFRIEVVQRTTPAINYLHRGGSTKVSFQGTPLLATGKGEAKVESQRGVIHVSAKFEHMVPAQSFGPEYLTYVLWAISPDGRPVNLGELTLDDYGQGSESSIEATSDIQTFGMIVTAEPYYGVTQPSDYVVMENVVRRDTQGVVETINARYELLPRGVYTVTAEGKPAAYVPIKVDKKNPFEMYEAENAVKLAEIAGADRYSGDSFQKAVDALAQAHKYQQQKPGQKPVITMAREAVVRAEDARIVAIRRQREEAEAKRLNSEKEKAEAARIKAEEEAQQRAKAEAQRVVAETAKTQAEAAAEAARVRAQQAAQQQAQAEQLKTQADAQRAAAEAAKTDALAAAQTAERERAAAEAAKLAADQARQAAEQARQAALAQQQQLVAEADRAKLAAAEADRQRAEADRQRQDAEQQQVQLRKQLLEQFNAILQTTDTARGLIVNMSDVLFDTGQYTLKPGAREKLAKVSGIILGHPGLKIEVEGHTDSVGGDDYNMKLSENRANAVRSYLVGQGISPENITAKGFGKTLPVADNSTAAGRQRNRRVELVVSGEILGTKITDVRTSTLTKPQ